MIDLTEYRIVDLSVELQPGVKTIDGKYVHGREVRRLELRQFIYEPDDMLMHWVDTETHIGTHVEGPTHFRDENKDLTELSLDVFMGEAVVLDMTPLGPKGGVRQPITIAHLTQVKSRDVVLVWSPYPGRDAPYLAPESARWLWQQRIKMLGVQQIGVEAPGSMATHEYLLNNDIPIIEGLTNLDTLNHDRVFFIGLPLRIRSMDSSWIRAVALEAR
jgi:kynurenine formamidase